MKKRINKILLKRKKEVINGKGILNFTNITKGKRKRNVWLFNNNKNLKKFFQFIRFIFLTKEGTYKSQISKKISFVLNRYF